MHRVYFLFLISCFSCNISQKSHTDSTSPKYESWYAYGGDAGGNRFVESTQINLENIQDLKVAWMYRTGELGQGSKIKEKLTFEATPIHFQGKLFLSTSYGKVIALHPSTGKELWTFDPKINRKASFSELTSRGVSAWTNTNLTENESCKYCILIGTINAKLIKLDAETGKLCKDFGSGGIVNLHKGIHVPEAGDHQMTSPPAIINNIVVVGSSIGDNFNADTGSGVVRAFDLRTGKSLWSWDPLADARETFKGPVGAANAWSIISTDPERDMIFVPTSSPSPDFYGGFRPNDNRYANSVVALRASTGELIWHFQTVHHDLWDYDLAAQPALVKVKKDGRVIPGVAQATKTGNLFLLHRETGVPIYPVEERAVPQTDVAGEYTSPTQPFSTLPNLMGQKPLNEKNIWGNTAEERIKNVEFISRARNEGIFTPPSLQGTILYPGNGSGTNWGSVAFDEERQLLIANTSRFATYVQLFPAEQYEDMKTSSEGYEVSSQKGTPYGMRRQTMISDSGYL
ncbi:MAG: PQQ-binding-like beta-propeller repeat protein, partial [Bacteroidota bacterium]